MSGRGGGRGGRGGRWFGRGNGSVTHDLIRDNLEDLGMDHFQQEDKSPPPMFPSVELPFPLMPKQVDAFSIEKNRELIQRFQTSDYFLVRNKEKKQTDIDPNTSADISFQKAVQKNSVPAEWQKYAPSELFESSLSQKQKSKANDLNFQKLENLEKSIKPEGENKDKEESDNENEEIEEDEVEEMDDDYMVDHYASDNEQDDDGRDGDEAVF